MKTIDKANQSVTVSRRSFLKAAGIAGGGLVVGFSVTGCSTPELPIEGQASSFVPNAFLQITPDNIVRFYCPSAEMGQGATTGLTTLIAEDLDIDPQAIQVNFAGAHNDYNNAEFDAQLTGGSTSIKAFYLPLRQMAANVRAVLIDAAANDLAVSRDAISTNNGVLKVSDRTYPYGQFALTASELPLTESAVLKPKSEFKYIGKEFVRLDAVAKSTGTAVFGIDVDIPDMHYAVVRRSPVVGGTVSTVDKDAAMLSPGVVDIVKVGSGIAVVAGNFWQAKKAAELLKIEWHETAFASVNSAQIKTDYQQAMRDQQGDAEAEQGNIEQGIEQASVQLDNQYWAPYLAHAPMEPVNAVVRIDGDQVDVWTGTQVPTATQGLVAGLTGLDKHQVRVHNCYLGGGFGRRAFMSHVIEATEVAMQTNKPIKLVWTREDDIRHGVYRPASLMNINAGINQQGDITNWSAKRVGGNITPGALTTLLPAMLPTIISSGAIDWMSDMAASALDGWFVDPTSVEGLYEDYDLPNREVHHVTLDHGLPLAFWRSVGHSFTAFAKETMIDELAEKSELNAVDFRVRNTQGNPRLQQVIRVAGDKMQTMTTEAGQSLGLAAHSSFASHVAQVAQVSIENGKPKVHKVLCVVDCGQVINPDIVRAQMEGSIMYGLTAALHGDLEIENGTIKESNFHDYPILRMNEAPEVEVIIVDSEEAPTGVGEPGLPPIAPAVANAIYAITGQRLRSLPLKPVV